MLKHTRLIVAGLPRTGTSVVWDVLRHHPQYDRHLYEPLRASVLHPGGHQQVWHGDHDAMAHAVAQYYHPSMEWSPSVLGGHNACEPIANYLSALMPEDKAVCVKFVNLLGRLPWFMSANPDALHVLMLRHPYAFCESLMPNPNGWTADGFREWFEGAFASGLCHSGTYTEYLAHGQNHPYMLLLVMWRRWAEMVAHYEDKHSEYAVALLSEDFRKQPGCALPHVLGSDPHPAQIARLSTTSKFSSETGQPWTRPVEWVEYTPNPSVDWAGIVKETACAEQMERWGYAVDPAAIA